MTSRMIVWTVGSMVLTFTILYGRIDCEARQFRRRRARSLSSRRAALDLRGLLFGICASVFPLVPLLGVFALLVPAAPPLPASLNRQFHQVSLAYVCATGLLVVLLRNSVSH